VADYLLAPAPRYAEFLDRGCVRELVLAHRKGTTDRQHLLLSILMLEVWLADFVPRATAHSATAEPARV
jgi:hypothetical protein